MAFERRVCVLRQVRKGFSADGSALTGAVYAERLGDELTVTPRIASLSPLRDGRYALYLWAEGKVYCLELKGSAPIRVENAPSVKAGFAVLLCFVKGESHPIAFGRCGAAPEEYAVMLKEEPHAPVPVPRPPVEIPVPNAPNVPLAPTVPVTEPDPPHKARAAARYHDDAIAAGNYFSYADDGDEKTSAARGEEGAAAPSDAGDRPRGTLTYYYSVKEKLDAAFREGERDTRYLTAFPHSEWVKKGNALLGIICEAGIPRLLCVAAEGDVPPAEMGDKAVFVPFTACSGAGMWCVMQDADTGEYVTVGE